MTVSKAMPFSRSMLRSASISTFILDLSPASRDALPGQRLRGLHDLYVGHAHVLAVDVEHHGLVVRGAHGARELRRVLTQHAHQPALHALEGAAALQRVGHAGRADLQRVT